MILISVTWKALVPTKGCPK